MWSVLQDLDAGQLLALGELEAGAAAGGDVAERALVEAEGAHRRGGVAASDDREAVDRRESLGDGTGAAGELLGLEDAHRTVPEHGAGAAEGRRERRAGLG